MKWGRPVVLTFSLLLTWPLVGRATSPVAAFKQLSAEFVAYSVVAADLDGDAQWEAIAGAFDGRVYVLDSGGSILWSYDVGSLPYALAVADVNGDGKKDIIAVVQDALGSVVALNYKKGVLWTFSNDRPLLSVAVGDAEGDGHREVAVGSFLGVLYVLEGKSGTVRFQKTLSPEMFICALAYGDLDGVAGDELVVGTSNKGLFVLNPVGKVLWRVKAKSPRDGNSGDNKSGKMSHPRYKMENVQSLCIEDLTGDGRNEVIVGSHPCGFVAAYTGNGRKLWQWNNPERFGTHTSGQLAVGDFTGNKKKEVFCLFNGVDLSGSTATSPAAILDGTGNLIGRYEPKTAFYSVCTACPDEKGCASVLLTSSVRGTGLNVVTFPKDKADPFGAYEDSGQTRILPALQTMAARGAKGEKVSTRDGFHFLYRCNYRDLYGKKGVDLEVFLRPLRSLPGEYGVVLTDLYENDPLSTLRKGKRKHFSDQKQILDMAGWFEQQKIPFFLNAGKHAKLYFRLDTLEMVLKVAKTSCRGFIVDENNYTRTDPWRRFLGNLDQMLSMLAKYPGKKLIMNEYLGFWHRFPMSRDKFEILFNPAYKEILVPIYKPNNMKSPELNLGVLVGLWKAGFIKDWGVGIYGDMWKWGSVFLSTPPDVEIRFAVEAASLGSRYFVFARNVSEDSSKILDLAPSYKAYFEELWRLVGQGAMAPVGDPSHLVISPVMLQAAENPEEVRKRERGTKIYWQDVLTMNGVLDTGFFLQATRKNYLSRYFYDMSHYYDGLFPTNPYGYVTILPEQVDEKPIAGVRKIYVVKGDGLLYEKEKKTLKPIPLEAFVGGFAGVYADIPFRTADAFLGVHKEDGGYVIYLINPHVFETKSVTARIVTNLGKVQFSVRDTLSGEAVKVQDNSLSLEIPAGLFRILQVNVD